MKRAVKRKKWAKIKRLSPILANFWVKWMKMLPQNRAEGLQVEDFQKQGKCAGPQTKNRKKDKARDAPYPPHGHNSIMYSKVCRAGIFSSCPNTFFCHWRRGSSLKIGAQEILYNTISYL